MSRDGLAEFNVVGSFPDMEQARKAMTRLGRSGLDAGKVSLLGRQVDSEIADPSDLADMSDSDIVAITDDSNGSTAADDAQTGDRDQAVVRYVGRRTGLGAIAGAAVGGTVALVAGAAVLGSPELGAAVAGVAAGGALGGVTAGIASIDLSDDWEQTYEDASQGKYSVVLVRADDREEAGTSAESLRKADAQSVRVFDSSGAPVTL